MDTLFEILGAVVGEILGEYAPFWLLTILLIVIVVASATCT